jgi:hypothetical protein
MHCRYGRKNSNGAGEAGYNDYLAREKYKTKARAAEVNNKWAFAAMMWSRAGEHIEAKKCEIILVAMANNSRIKLIECEPDVLST